MASCLSFSCKVHGSKSKMEPFNFTDMLEYLARIFHDAFHTHVLNIVIDCPDPEIRSACGKCLQAIIVGLFRLHGRGRASVGSQLIDMCVSVNTFDRLSKTWRNLHSLMETIRDIGNSSAKARIYMLKCGLLGKLVDMMLGLKNRL